MPGTHFLRVRELLHVVDYFDVVGVRPARQACRLERRRAVRLYVVVDLRIYE